jgi:hypothetical protein
VTVDVRLEVDALCEAAAAIWADIGALASMRPPVGVEVVLLGEHLGASVKIAGEAFPLCLSTASLNLNVLSLLLLVRLQ